ncbi:DUF6415 family natural product biosynthesis protein [Streptomyces lunaelactis]|uniref:DUF6415 family natural product biosynthesis protein n=1 Tax=Streptomyces lunaelactis TaxID=1535768 RepID=UPI001585476F|nr:DUF6415 family natural product biosynthesis protein [Streptomyces lunaelactis]NUK28034.1 hypothetical protein [Streptomyces lunaelactis]
MKAQHVRHWEQDDDVVERVLSGLRLSLILDRLYLDTFYRDLTAVLHENAAPTMDEIEKLADRLRGALMPLVAIVLEHHDQPGEASSRTITRARALQEQAPPGNLLPARAHLRQLAMATQDLLKLLRQEDTR